MQQELSLLLTKSFVTASAWLHLPFLRIFELLTRNKNDLDIIDTNTIAEMTFDECCTSLEN